MNTLDHCRISARKFGGIADDYYVVHQFINSSKMFYFHDRHRILLHNLFGIELSAKYLGEFIKNSEGKKILVMDVAAEHCKEDLSGMVPTIYDWLSDNDAEISDKIDIPHIDDKDIEDFIFTPYMRSNLKSSLLITYSNFGVYLVSLLMGNEKAKKLASVLRKDQTVQEYLSGFTFTKKWQFTPDKTELAWLKETPPQTEITI